MVLNDSRPLNCRQGLSLTSLRGAQRRSNPDLGAWWQLPRRELLATMALSRNDAQ